MQAIQPIVPAGPSPQLGRFLSSSSSLPPLSPPLRHSHPRPGHPRVWPAHCRCASRLRPVFLLQQLLLLLHQLLPQATQSVRSCKAELYGAAPSSVSCSRVRASIVSTWSGDSVNLSFTRRTQHLSSHGSLLRLGVHVSQFGHQAQQLPPCCRHVPGKHGRDDPCSFMQVFAGKTQNTLGGGKVLRLPCAGPPLS